MANPLDTPLKIVNASASLVGSEPIKSFSDGSAIGLAMGHVYETRVREALTSNRWRFNTKQAQMTRIAFAPVEEWDASYQIPTDCMLLHSVSVNGDEIAYDLFGSEVYCNAGASDVVIADYSFRAEERTWPPLFTSYVIDLLAADIAISAARDEGVASMFNRGSEIRRRFAGAFEAQSRRVKKLDVGAMRNARRNRA
jgi:hypothetical protein